ncbi:hypothetical protein BS47DRAFT_278333 [Hydnum rufescens UP504]|uniref:Uncharacterized protein n=1 Tax=Hydnum rufescens UP504 TaxID=1448309 RepID=A0A9P6AM21_9AGAM|nr:hypothetical protein BS47DRAFT_278333 [Hydnum rufescens UP504]
MQSNPLHWSDVRMVLEFKAKQRPKSTGQFSKLQDPARSAMQSTTSSAASNGSTGSKCLHDLLARGVCPGTTLVSQGKEGTGHESRVSRERREDSAMPATTIFAPRYYISYPLKERG